MEPVSTKPVLIAGAGIAGLTLAVALARQGIASKIFEQAPQLHAFGAGLQLSPNATHILAELGVLPHLHDLALQPDCVQLKDAKSLRLLARVPLGKFAQTRWNAPYLVAHRADLQQALLTQAAASPLIKLSTGMRLSKISTGAHDRISACFKEENGASQTIESHLLIGADGVWSQTRQNIAGGASNRFSGQIAWRTTISTESPAGKAFCQIADINCVTAFLHGDFHLVAYPLRAGREINLVAFTPTGKNAVAVTSPVVLLDAFAHASNQLARLAELVEHWTPWPLNTVDFTAKWSAPGLVLIGDAAHAVTPFAAQGAAMAIEDAALLAQMLAQNPATMPNAIASWEESRKTRLARVARRGALNKLAWNATGPVALARNFMLRVKSPESLAADLDWLYGWRLPQV